MSVAKRRVSGPSLFVAAVWLSLAGGCAKVGDPLPPERAVPAADDLTLSQDADRVLLGFTLPDLELERLEVYRYCGGAEPEDKDFVLSDSVSVTRLVAADRSARRYTFVTPRQSDPVCYYVIRFVNPSRVESGFSNRVRTQ